jgi:hypothetical protein
MLGEFLVLTCIITIIVTIFLVIGMLMSPNEEIQNIREIDSLTVALLYSLSFIIPLAGFIVGAIYASKENKHYTIVGRNCLIWSAINIVFTFILLVMFLAG